MHLHTQLARRLPSGLVIGVLVGALLAWTIGRQPASAAPAGPTLLLDLAWLGFVYDTVDALILAVIPVMAPYATRPADAVRPAAGRLRAAAAWRRRSPIC